jgi:hypothetical protein
MTSWNLNEYGQLFIYNKMEDEVELVVEIGMDHYYTMSSTYMPKKFMMKELVYTEKVVML